MEFFSWWYTTGWIQFSKSTKNRIIEVWNIFSIPILLRTMFSPWKRIQTNPGKSLQSHMQALLDNIISRFVGFSIRLLTIIAGLFCIVLISIISMLTVIAWPLIPVVIPMLIFWGLL